MVAVPVSLMIIPTIVVLSVALLSTNVAVPIERGKGYYAGVPVNSFNLAGTAPFLTDLWFSGHNFHMPVDVITNILAYLVIYLAAMFCWAV